MLQLLALACILALGAAEAEYEPAAAASPVFVHRDEHEYLQNHGHGDEHQLLGGRPHVSADILSKQHKIIEHVYSPDYYEPTVILDYRYLKSGGRDYTRGPGGQILILPHNVRSHEHKEHRDYDSLIEFLRLRNLAQHEAKRQRQEDQHHFSHLHNIDVGEGLNHAHHEERGHDRGHDLGHKRGHVRGHERGREHERGHERTHERESERVHGHEERWY